MLSLCHMEALTFLTTLLASLCLGFCPPLFNPYLSRGFPTMNESESPDLGGDAERACKQWQHVLCAVSLLRDSPPVLHNYHPVGFVVSHDVCMVNTSVNVHVLMYMVEGLNG